MTKAQLNEYRKQLEARKAELEEALRRREAMAIQQAADLLEEVQLSAERELAISTADTQAKALRAVRAALARIAAGTYGICAMCEEEINPKRLKHIPWALYCVKCQEEIERQSEQEETEQESPWSDGDMSSPTSLAA